MCVHTCDTAVNEKRLHGRTGKNRSTAVREKSQHGRAHRKSEHGRVHRGNADTAVHTQCTLVDFCTAAHSGMYTDPSAYSQGIPNPYCLRTHHTRLPVFQPDQHLDVKKTAKN